jgi:hypothetical protein
MDFNPHKKTEVGSPSNISIKMSFQFNPVIAQNILDAIVENESPMTAREIAKEIGVDKHIINQHLYKMENMVKSAHRIPLWSLPDEETQEQTLPPNVSVYLQNLQGEISTMLLTDFFEVEHLYLPDFETLPNGFLGYRMRPLTITDEEPIEIIDEMD